MSLLPPLAGRPPEVVLRSLELTITRRLDGLLHGQHQGLLPGSGTEAGEARVYRAGDDVRLIDWNVTARVQEPHVRMPVADRELETWILADLSASLEFGTAACAKRDLAVAAVAAVGFLTAHAGNRTGAVLARGETSWTVPAGSGRDHVLALVHRTLTTPQGDGTGPTDLAAAIADVGRLARRRGLVVVVSDFLAEPGWEGPLRALAARHDVLAVEVVDPRELDLPDVGHLTVVDPETGQTMDVPTGSRRFRARYAAAAAEQRAAIARAVRAAGADHLVLRTDRDWLFDVVRFVGRRRRRRAGAPRPVERGGP